MAQKVWVYCKMRANTLPPTLIEDPPLASLKYLETQIMLDVLHSRYQLCMFPHCYVNPEVLKGTPYHVGCRSGLYIL